MIYCQTGPIQNPYPGDIMTRQMRIPNDLQWVFQRLIDHLPVLLKDDEHTQQVILTYLKFGDEKLARQRIEILKTQFREKTASNPSEIQTLLDLHTDGSDNLDFPTD